MASIDPKRYRANTLFPMPAQTGEATVTVNVPSGTSNGGAGQANALYADVQLSTDTDYVRIGMNASRATESRGYVGSPFLLYFDDAIYICFVSARGNGLFRCYVLVTTGFDASYWSTTATNNITFHLVGFRVP